MKRREVTKIIMQLLILGTVGMMGVVVGSSTNSQETVITKTENTLEEKERNEERKFLEAGPVYEMLEDYNVGLLENKARTLEDIDGLKKEYHDIIESLNQKMEVYHEQLISKTEKVVVPEVPKLFGREIEGLDGQKHFEITCSSIEGYDAPPIVDISIVSETSPEAAQSTTCLNAILAKMMRAEAEMEYKDVVLNAQLDETTTIGVTGSVEVEKSISSMLKACEQDVDILRMVQECGYPDVHTFMHEMVTGNIPLDTTNSRIEIKGSIEELAGYMMSGMNDVIPVTESDVIMQEQPPIEPISLPETYAGPLLLSEEINVGAVIEAGSKHNLVSSSQLAEIENSLLKTQPDVTLKQRRDDMDILIQNIIKQSVEVAMMVVVALLTMIKMIWCSVKALRLRQWKLQDNNC